MKTLKVAAACLNQTPMDWQGNFRRIEGVIHDAQKAGVELLCLPELAITGYGCEDMFLSPDLCERAHEILEKICHIAPQMIVVVGLPWRHHHTIFNAAAYVVGGRVLGLFAKQHLAGDGVHYEPRWFCAWPAWQVVTTQCCGEEVPMGDLLFDIGGVRVGTEICEDAWVADRPGSKASAYGLDLITNPSASHFSFGKQGVRERFVLEASRAFGVGYLYANLLGNESGRIIFDGGAMIANGGNLVASEKRFSFKEWTLIEAIIDIEVNALSQSATDSREVEVNLHPGLVKQAFDWKYGRQGNAVPSPAIERRLWGKEEEFSRSVALGLFDYMRKSYSRGFVLSLSGGADSSSIACLVKFALDFSLAELGEKQLRQRLSYLKLPKNTDDWMRHLLACVYQASENSGEATESAAQHLAESIGAEYQRWHIADLVTGYTSMVSQGLGRELSWEKDDLALQNIQARVRAPGIWMLTNLRNALLVATSNRSEAAVGYATMDGDTSGGISPLAGIDKHFLRHWLKWLESEGLPAKAGDGRGMEGIQPIPALAEVNRLQPTAELRPAEYEQTDEGDLMPYEVLNFIEQAAMRDKRKASDVLALLRTAFSDYEAATLRGWVQKFYRLWSRNQWKRERYAVSFHLDAHNLDPKTWCRFPILSAGFSEELSEL